MQRGQNEDALTTNDLFVAIATPIAGGVRLSVRAKPGSAKARPARIVEVGRDRCALEIAVAAPPVEGKANAAICARIAELVGVRKVDVVLVAGAAGKLKLVDVAGDPARILKALRGTLGLLDL